MPEWTSFGRMLAHYRAALDLRQHELAQKVPCALISIKRFENDTLRPSRDTAARLATVLAVPADQRARFIQLARTASLAGSDRSTPPAPVTSAVARLPSQATTFVGRAAELAKLTALLDQPACRLIALVGPGGIGKTRLAVQLAAQHGAAFPDGVAFVALNAVSAPEFVAPAIIAALGLATLRPDDQQTYLIQHLRTKHMLLVLDNFEHLLGDLQLIEQLVQHAPHVKLLITSRERLQLRDEWTFNVHGLAVAESSSAALAHADAVQLFLHTAQRAQANWTPTSADLQAIVQICQLVRGIPLAIELAATWVRLLDCATIGREIRQNIAFLTTSLRDVSPRHRSMRAVIDQSWHMLTEAEQGVLSRLAVFRGGFGKDAAAQVAGATLPLLLGLVDKSLLERTSNGRFELHELVRQYAADKLAAQPNVQTQAFDQHSAWVVDLLQQYKHAIIDQRQREALLVVGDEIENVQAGAQWAVARGNIQALSQTLHGLCLVFDGRGWVYQGATFFASLLDELDQATERHGIAMAAADGLRGALLVGRGMFVLRLGRFEQAYTLLLRGMTTLRELGEHGDTADQTSGAGWWREPVVLALQELGHVCRLLGRYVEAEQHLNACQRFYNEINNVWSVWGRAGCSYYLGLIAADGKDYQSAEVLFQDAYTRCSSCSDLIGRAFALVELGRLALWRGALTEAIERFDESRDVLQNVGGVCGIVRVRVFALAYLGRAYHRLGDYPAALHQFQQALHVATLAQGLPETLDTLLGVAALLLDQGEPTHARDVLHVIAQHPASAHEMKDAARTLVTGPALADSTWSSSATVREPAPDLEQVVAQILHMPLALG